jgi:hypothetical protein
MSVRRALAAALLVPLAVLSACTDDPVPKMPDPTTSAPSPTESTSTAAPESPEDFIRRWQGVVDAMQATGDTTEFRSMNERCEPCDSFAAQVEATYEAGGAIRSQGSVVRKVTSASSAGDTFDATVKTSRTTVTGPEPTSYPGGLQVFRIRLNGDATDLKVIDYRVLAQ